ncbi:hypothetical protein V6N13_049766 [Hibiscus sabdariffa]
MTSLHACGNSVSTTEHIATTTLNGLPPEYKPFVAVITTSRESFTLENVTTILVDVEAQQDIFDQTHTVSMSAHTVQLPSQGSGTASTVNTSQRPYCQQANNGGRGRSKNRFQCQLCGKMGHLVDRCFRRFDQSYAGVSGSLYKARDSEGSPNVNMCSFDTNVLSSVATTGSPRVTGVTTTSCPQCLHVAQHSASTPTGQWFVDIGTTHHVTPEASNVNQGTNFISPGKLLVGDGTGLSIDKVGCATLKASSRTLILRDLLLVLLVTKNLLSVSKFAKDNGVYFKFHYGHCVV